MLKAGFAVVVACASVLPFPQSAPRPAVRPPLPRIDVRVDGKGVNLAPWVRDFIAQVDANWSIPEEVWDLRGHVAATLSVRRNGVIDTVSVTASAALAALEHAVKAALASVTAREPLPSAYPDDRASVLVTFYYNEAPVQETIARPGWPPPGVYSPGPGIVLPRVIRDVKPLYTSDAMRAKVSGAVMLACVVRADGTVGEVEVVRSLDPWLGLDESAIAAAKQWRFQPGTRDGKPVPVAVTMDMMFTLR